MLDGGAAGVEDIDEYVAGEAFFLRSSLLLVLGVLLGIEEGLDIGDFLRGGEAGKIVRGGEDGIGFIDVL